MSYRNLLSALIFVASIFWFSQGAYAEPEWGGDWSGGWGSDKVVGQCSGKGTVVVGNNVADLSMDGTCNFSKPQTQPPTFNVPCHVDLTYTLPTAPTFDPVPGGFEQKWVASCNTPGLQVTGLLHCPAVPGHSPEINDTLGLDGRNGNTITSNICATVFGTASFPVLDAKIQYETPDSLGRVIDLSQTSSWNGCHADIVNDPTADPNCLDGNDKQKFLGTGTNPVTRAFCSYTPGDEQPINSQCNAPDSGNITVNLFADRPPTAEPGIISISLDSVDLNSFVVNGSPSNGACTIKKSGGKDVIECKLPTCNSQGNFVFSGGIATLTAKRDPQPGEKIGTGIQCINQVRTK
jgi:hypothetical protein